MERTLIADLPAKVEERVRVRGWAQAVRDQKRIQFVIVRDETGLAQAVLEKSDPPSELNERVSALTAESAVTLTGTVAADERVKLGGLELRVEGLELDAPAEPELPVTAESALDTAQSINIRGLQDFGRVNVLVDGARQNFQRSGHIANGVYYIEPEMLKGVDITRGPTSVIYGSGAIGGVAAFSVLDADDILRGNHRRAA